ncbi:hypothetical protein F2Q70_00031391 [Brassica cretica]|uniref:Uncharacterized protein n=1 Tax=Brassica cretica TaxID=69181 RepID=A0A8S9FE13_BRACR|nr:hypothetical protein F2Q70_00031391 [Brassica cretica]
MEEGLCPRLPQILDNLISAKCSVAKQTTLICPFSHDVIKNYLFKMSSNKFLGLMASLPSYSNLIGRDVNWALPSRPVSDRCGFVFGRDTVGLSRAGCGPENSCPIPYLILCRPSRTVPWDIGYYTVYFLLHEQT